ncbi:MAG: hypothetical protein LQ339_001892 [Xanthoria mediterranea]|nr:MAG: hypothetical protein LQ339_001892 [Xanthoria mediterranea]
MPPIPPLFKLAIEPRGSITCTQPSPRVYLLTFDSAPDNRLTPDFCAAFLLALDIVDRRFDKGVIVTTSAIPKFYSNGLDFESVFKSKSFFPESLYPLWKRLLTYPMPTIALINGHAFAAGMMTAMMHDYRFMNPHRGFLCLNELEFGASLKAPMSSIFRQKLPSPNTYRTIVLEAKRFNALEALQEGIVDGLGMVPEGLKFIQEMGLVDKAKSGVYGQLKAEMWRETVAYLDDYVGSEKLIEERMRGEERLQERSERRVAEWEKSKDQKGAKL